MQNSYLSIKIHIYTHTKPNYKFTYSMNYFYAESDSRVGFSGKDEKIRKCGGIGRDDEDLPGNSRSRDRGRYSVHVSRRSSVYLPS